MASYDVHDGTLSPFVVDDGLVSVVDDSGTNKIKTTVKWNDEDGVVVSQFHLGVNTPVNVGIYELVFRVGQTDRWANFYWYLNETDFYLSFKLGEARLQTGSEGQTEYGSWMNNLGTGSHTIKIEVSYNEDNEIYIAEMYLDDTLQITAPNWNNDMGIGGGAQSILMVDPSQGDVPDTDCYFDSMSFPAANIGVTIEPSPMTVDMLLSEPSINEFSGNVSITPPAGEVNISAPIPIIRIPGVKIYGVPGVLNLEALEPLVTGNGVLIEPTPMLVNFYMGYDEGKKKRTIFIDPLIQIPSDIFITVVK